MKRQIIVIMMLALMVFAGSAIAEDLPPFPYQMTSQDAFDAVVPDGNVFILDVRTPEEWIWVGHPGENKFGEGVHLEGYVVNIPYMVYHKGSSKGDELIVNRKFVRDVKQIFFTDDRLILMCRSGGRSTSAAYALVDAGFTDVWNMTYGFEGEKDGDYGYRIVNGWKFEGFPYKY